MTANSKQVNYCFPKDLLEASHLKQQYGEAAQFIAGGTDLLLNMERQKYHPQALIDLSRIPSLQKLEFDGKQVVIGSAVTYSQLLRFAPILERAPFLAQAIRTIGGVQIRNIATLAGNIINASPAGDTLPPLYCLDAHVGINGPDGQRSMPIDKFVLGVRRTALATGELVTWVSIELPGPNWYGRYEKLGLRRAMAIAVVSIALLLQVKDGHVVQARMALGAVAPTVIRVAEAEACLVGRAMDEKLIEEASLLAYQASRPIDDVRASGRYRREAVRGLVRRALHSMQSEFRIQE